MLEYFLLLIFTRQFIHEEQQLWRFIIFQSQIPYEELDAKRMKYNALETNVAKQQIGTVYFLFVGFLACFVLDIALVRPGSGYEWIGFITTLMILFAFTESFLALIFYTYFYLQAMKWYQNYEYQRHWRRVLTQSLLWIVSLSFMSLVAYLFCFESACLMTSVKFNLVSENNSRCGKLRYQMLHVYQDNAWLPTIVQFATVAPVLIFYVFISMNPPHDCYECFNRLPNTRYSIFQLTKAQRL